MSRTFDVSSTAERHVQVEVLRVLFEALRKLGLTAVLIGAAARDLVLLIRDGESLKPPSRATLDVDLAVAIDGFGRIDELADATGGRRVGEHRIRVMGVDVDIVPFGPLEVGRRIVFPGESVLDVSGLSEASQDPWLITVTSGLTVPTLSLPAQVMLKVLAWRDRGHQNQKDAIDLGLLLSASSEGPFEDEAWEDAVSRTLADSDIFQAGPLRVGRLAVAELGVDVARVVLDVLDAPGNREALLAYMHHRAMPDNAQLSSDRFDGLRLGIVHGLEHPAG